MKKWELFAIDRHFLNTLAKEAVNDEAGRFWEVQGQRLANKACEEKGFYSYIDIGGWIEKMFDENEWLQPKPFLVEGIREAQRKYKIMGKEYKFYLFWNKEQSLAKPSGEED